MVEASDSGGFWSQAVSPTPEQGSYQVYGQNNTVGAVLASTGGGGFEFPSVDEMNAVLGMWKERQASITEKRNLISQTQQILTGLANDPESQGYLKQARESLDLLYTQHDSMLKYVENYVQKLTDATNAKHANEDDNKDAFTSNTEGTAN